MLLDLELFKKHVRSDDFDGDDALLRHYLDAAFDSTVDYIGRPVEEIAEDSGEIPARIIQATMMLAAHWYNQRESVASTQMTAVPDSYEALLKPFVKLV